jgi:hypothetical protein
MRKRTGMVLNFMNHKLKVITVALGAYFLSYCVWTVGWGSYEYMAYGWKQSPDGTPFIGPKKRFGKVWVIRGELNNEGELNLGGWIFLPLTSIDRKIWHKRTYTLD